MPLCFYARGEVSDSHSRPAWTLSLTPQEKWVWASWSPWSCWTSARSAVDTQRKKWASSEKPRSIVWTSVNSYISAQIQFCDTQITTVWRDFSEEWGQRLIRHRHQSGSYNVCMWPLLKHLITNAAEQLCRKHRHWALIRDIVCINSALVWSCMSLLWVCKTSQVLQLYTRSTNYSFSESSVLWIKCQEVWINVLYPLKMICYQSFEMKEVELAVLPLKTT